MLECSVCRRQFDGRFKVMVPPSNEVFDSIECARQAAMARGLDAAALAPVVLPTLETAATPVGPVASTSRKGIAALAAILLVPSQAALAGGVGLAAAGTAASIYLTTRPPTQPRHSSSVTAAAPAPALPFAQRRKVSEKPAVRAPLRLAVPRPPDAAARAVVIARRARPAVKHAQAGNLVSTRSSTHSSSVSTSGGPQLISRPVPVSRTAPVSAPTPVAKPSPAPAPVPSSSPAPKPKPEPSGPPKPGPTVTVPSEPAAPTAPASDPTDPAPASNPTNPPVTPNSTDPAATSNPTDPAATSNPTDPAPASDATDQATSGGTRELASASTTATNPTPKPALVPQQAVAPPQGGRGGGGSVDGGAGGGEPCHGDDGRPGDGWGDDNHEHSGPPGHSSDQGDKDRHDDHSDHDDHGDHRGRGDHDDHGDHGGGHGKGH
jgi:hypothetical protein